MTNTIPTTAPTTTATPRLPIAAAATTAAVALVVGVLQVTHEPSSDSTVEGVEHLIIAGLTAFLLTQLPLLWWAARASRRHWPALLAGSGMVPLAALAAQSNVLGHDASYFALVALPVNFLWLAGLIAIAVTGVRNGTLPRWAGILLPFTWVCAIPLSSLGGAVLAAGYFAALATRWPARRQGTARA